MCAFTIVDVAFDWERLSINGYVYSTLITLTENLTIYALFIKQFWTTATSNTNINGEVELTASIDGQAKTITEASLRRHLKLEDKGGIISLPNTEIFEQLASQRYATDSDKLTFQKVTRGYSGDDIPLFSSMITAPDTSPSRIMSSPSLSPQHTPNTKKVYGTAIPKLAKRVKKLEMQVKTGKASRRIKIVLSEDEAVEEDSSK
ncbi:hypothetical protein Tco_0716586 [Tanacetum coccineum]